MSLPSLQTFRSQDLLLPVDPHCSSLTFKSVSEIKTYHIINFYVVENLVEDQSHSFLTVLFSGRNEICSTSPDRRELANSDALGFIECTEVWC